ncbi:MAG: 3-oxoacyl-ACP reductase FabG, partial [Deltaproteobacteria bacterium]|nr:3-oxoacyl-ACP reductase FabG [Deltaproteobacteria bacterium]
MARLQGKVVIVTGGAKGLGREFCLGLAKEGARVVMAAHRFDSDEARAARQKIEALGGLAMEVDVASEEDTKRMAAQVLQTYGRIDVLVNNAAMYGGISRVGVLETPPEEWDRVMTVNLRGPFLSSRAVIPSMVSQGGGKIINIASEVAFTGSKGMIHYVTSKGGVLAFTKSLATELGPHNICVNAVAPGYTDTPGSRSLGDVKKYDVSKTPLARLEQPEDLVGAVLFFASEESNFVNGQTLVV